MPSHLDGLDIVDPYPQQQQSPRQLPPEFSAQLDLWSTLNFNSIDDPLPVGGFSMSNTLPFSLGNPHSPSGTLDDLVRLGEEELRQRPTLFAHGGRSSVDPFHVSPRSAESPASSARPAKKQRTSAGTPSLAVKKQKHPPPPPPVEEEEDDDDIDLDTKSLSGAAVSTSEDKRRRNTAASARFRAKKKEREAAIEQHAKGLESRVSELERECEALRRENGWLKGLVVGVTQGGGDFSVGGVTSKRKRE